MVGTKIGSAIGVPIAAFLITGYGWRAMFATAMQSGYDLARRKRSLNFPPNRGALPELLA
jgi:hypothetical protein